MKTVLLIALAASLLAPTATASERRFTYTYESGVLRPGAREFEPWVTFRHGKNAFFSRLDTRLEIELGLSDRLQTALYLNMNSELKSSFDGRVGSSELKGVSSEWKFKVADPVADPMGFALYGEVSAGPSELELEGKLILDKRHGRFLTALNLSLEQEWKFEEPETERELKLEIDAGGCWLLSSRFAAGLELRAHTVIPSGGESTRSALFLGPTVSYAHDQWWVAISALPQVKALAGSGPDRLELVEHEKVEARLLFGFDF